MDTYENKLDIKFRLDSMKKKIKYISEKNQLKNYNFSSNEFTFKKKELAVVCCFFNACHYQNRIKNYKIFRKEILKTGIRFLTVELAFGNDEFELTDFPEVIQLRTAKENILWQKESLLNIGIQKLIDEEFKKIVWMDADIIFEDKNWIENISRELDKNPVCQGYENIYREENNDMEISSIKYFNDTGRISDGVPVPGGVWAARSEILKKILLYDGTILGGGDTFFLFGCYCYDTLKENQVKKFFKQFHPELRNHYFKWAEKLGSLVKGNVGYAKNSIKILHHGNTKNKKHKERFKILAFYDFNPEIDIKKGKNLICEWASDKPELHKKVKEYFYSRKEDD